LFGPVSEEEIVSVLVDARALGRDDALTNDDVAQSALEVLTLPVVWKVAARPSTSFTHTHTHTHTHIVIIILAVSSYSIMLATARIATEHASFNRIRQVAPVCTHISRTWFHAST